MVTLYYALRDLSRRKLQTIATLICLAVCVASVTFLTLTGMSLGVSFSRLMWRMSIGLDYLFSRYLTMAALLSLAIGLAVLSSTMDVTIVQRRREIGVMKAIGLAEEVSSFFVAESVVIALIGCLVGVLFGLATYMGLVFSMEAMGFTLPTVVPVVTLSVIFVSCFLISFAFTYLPLKKALMEAKAVEAMMRQQTPGVRLGFWSKTSFLFKIPLRSLEIERTETLRTIATCFLCMMLVSILVFGGHIITCTANNYIRRGIGENTVLVASPEMAEGYVTLLSFQERGEGELDYLSESYAVKDGFVEWLESQPHVVCVDPRIITEAEVLEVKYVEAIPGPAYRIVGDDRVTEALIVGVKPERLTSGWVHIGKLLGEDNEGSVVMGDSMLDVVYDFSLEQLRVFDVSFPIVGVCIDPLNKGYTMYVSFERLSAILSVTRPNVLLVEVERGNDSFHTIQQKAWEHGLQAVDLRSVLDENLAAVQRLWTTISILPSMSLISMSIALLNYFTTTILGRISDFKVMKAIGVKWGYAKKIIAIKICLLVIPCCLAGMVAGLFFAMNFLVPFQTLPSTNVLFLNLTAFGVSTLLIFSGSFYFSTKLLSQLYKA